MAHKIILTFLCCLCSLSNAGTLRAQVYNYDAVGIMNTEACPSSLTFKDATDRLRFTQRNTFPISRTFNRTEIRMATRSTNEFMGVGGGLQWVSLGDSASYGTAHVSGSYRNILLNNIFLRLGGAYKVSLIQSLGGAFGFYAVDHSQGIKMTTSIHNINLSLTLSDADNRFFAAFGWLNQPLPGFAIQSEQVFPRYLYVEAGNILRWFNPRKKSFLHLAYQRVYSPSHASFDNFYLDLFLPGMAIDRNLRLAYALRIGHVGGPVPFFHTVPKLGITSDKWTAWLSGDLPIVFNDSSKPYRNALELGLQFKFLHL